jgi:signal transduction histidine kinase
MQSPGYNAVDGFLPRPVLLSLLLGVLLPTACVLWFMSQAMNNERLALQQKSLDLYNSQLQILMQDFNSQWESNIRHIQAVAAHADASALFAEVVRKKLASAILVYDKEGLLRYPILAKAVYKPESDPKWAHATRLEFQQGDLKGAIESYRAIAAENPNTRMTALALNALARCYAKLNDARSAIKTLTQDLADPRFAQATDAQGRLIQLNAQLRAVELMYAQPASWQYKPYLTQLSQRLNDYQAQSKAPLPSKQRVFLMQQLQSRWPGGVSFPTLDAENLALDFLNTLAAPRKMELTPTLSATALADTWRLSLAGDAVELLYTKTYLQSALQALAQQKFPEVGVLLLPPTGEIRTDGVLASTPVGKLMPGWRVTLSAKEGASGAAATARISLYLWAGILITGSIVLLSVITGGYINRQIRENRLKNDLIATVSHELKTPLSSMRLFVDTLLDEQPGTASNTKEYLQLILKENLRLSRLIDDFLTFSRMERGKQPFVMQPCRIETLVHPALQAVQKKLETSDFEVTIDIAPNLPQINADADFMLTALINLIDNAHKYSGDSKRILIAAYRRDKHICIEVQDWGIGMSRRHHKKIFNRFYRIDQSLSRETDGCGLGLNIVSFIVKAHTGKIEVESELNQGSLFRLCLPAIEISKTNLPVEAS